VKVACFSPKSDLIIVKGKLRGPLNPDGRLLRLAFDTAADETIIAPEILDELGYNPRQGEAITVMRSVVGREHGYMIRVERFECLGHPAEGRIRVERAVS